MEATSHCVFPDACDALHMVVDAALREIGADDFCGSEPRTGWTVLVHARGDLGKGSAAGFCLKEGWLLPTLDEVGKLGLLRCSLVGLDTPGTKVERPDEAVCGRCSWIRGVLLPSVLSGTTPEAGGEGDTGQHPPFHRARKHTVARCSTGGWDRDRRRRKLKGRPVGPDGAHAVVRTNMRAAAPPTLFALCRIGAYPCSRPQCI